MEGDGSGGGATNVGASIPVAADFSSTSFSSRRDPLSNDPLHSLRAPRTNNLSDDNQGWSRMPPPTPAVQFYSHTAQMSNHQKQSSPSRSNGQGTENFQLHHTNYKNFKTLNFRDLIFWHMLNNKVNYAVSKFQK